VSGELILIVDDNDKNLKLARDILRYHGFRTLEASTGRQGIDLARESDPDLVLLDIQLPDIDGVSALRELRASAGTEGTPVVALTAFAMKSDRQRFLDAGFDGYIAKPIDVRMFPLQVREFCPAKGA
jgi:two-component system cell cycle response regulator DivK